MPTPTSNFQPVRLLDPHCCYKFIYLMVNSVDLALQKPADLELHCLQRQGTSGFSRIKVNSEAAPNNKHMFSLNTCIVLYLVSEPSQWNTHNHKHYDVCGTLQWCHQDNLWPTSWWKAWAWEAKDDMETADREGLQRVEALSYQPSW